MLRSVISLLDVHKDPVALRGRGARSLDIRFMHKVLAPTSLAHRLLTRYNLIK